MCPHMEFTSGQRNGGQLFCMGRKYFNTNSLSFFGTVKQQKIVMLEFQKQIVTIILASFGRNKPVKSLVFP